MVLFDGMNRYRSSNWPRWPGVTLGVAALYFASARVGLLLAYDGSQTSPVWPPAGIALAMLLLYGRRVLPGILLGALGASFYQAYQMGGSGGLLLPVVAVALGSTGAALLASWLIRRLVPEFPFASLKGTLVFVLAAVLGSALSALTATFTLQHPWSNPDFVQHFLVSWWLGDLTAVLVLTPVLISWLRLNPRSWTGARLFHLVLYCTLFMLALNLWFAPAAQSGLPVPPLFMMLPLLVWAALGFKTREVSLILLLFAGFALYRTLTGSGIYANAGLGLALLELQLLVVVVATSLLAMNAAVLERQRLNHRLRDANRRLEGAAEERMQALEQSNRRLQEQLLLQARSEKRLQESEDRLSLITQATTDGIWEWEPSGPQFRYSTRFKALLGYGQFDQLPLSLRFWLRRMPAADRQGLLKACRNHLQGLAPLNASFRMRNKAGQLRWYRVLGQATWNGKGAPILLAGSIIDVNGEKTAHDVLVNEKRLLERMTSGANINEVMQLVAELACVRFMEAGCAIALVDESGVNPAQVAQRNLAPLLPGFLAGIKVGPQAVSGSAAIYFNSQIMVEDVSQHPDWRPYLGMLRDTGLKACWAVPVRNRHGSVLGSIALHFSTRCYPSAEELEFLDRVARLAGIAVEQDSIRTTLQSSEQRYRELYHNNPAMFFSLDRDGIIRSVNQFGAEHLGYEPAQLVERAYSELIEEQSRVELQDALQQALESPGKVIAFETRKQCADGRTLWVRDSLRALGSRHTHAEVLVVAEDITDIRELSDRLAYHASHDSLTGLINRRKFEAELVNAIYEAGTLKMSHALCYLDLDMFKVINDTCGHAAGDELLRQLGRLLEETVAGRGIIARLGGDEFGLLIRNSETDSVVQLAGEVRNRIAEYQFLWERRPYHVGVSIGVVGISRGGTNLTALMSAADSACYAAKEGGRNRIQVYSENDRDLEQRRDEMQWVVRIPRGIRENRFALAIQEIVPVSRGRTPQRHFELLIRYHAQDGSWVQPGEFLPAAERYSLATMLDRWVFVQLINLLQQHPQWLAQQWVFNINLSGQSVSNEDFQKFIINRIVELKLPTAHICFEITETSAITNLSRAQQFIASLKELGCRFALDDFGSGLSTFGYLKSLPVDFIKIDGQFVRDIETDEMDFAIVKSINEVGHALGKQTVAEFVENAAIARKLEAIGVDWLQGYYVGVPVMLADWLQQNADMAMDVNLTAQAGQDSSR